MLWNPSTRRCQKLLVTETEFPREGFCCCQYIIYEFGHECVSDDYKVVRIIQFYGISSDTFDSDVKVYSFRSNSWKRIQNVPYYLCYKMAYGMLANGALFWVVSRKPESNTARLIAAFDLATEAYRLVPQPVYSNKNFHMNVGVLEGCL
ncbi:F-box protein CPR1-like [Coffea eugenioides]|uniref:F-box protein CPR1-like n=1 Tax=Coffea eugenioides TaxID=49369 RepID=UPI000F610AAD|nr:F-box protein CPR1-like [Coffea eugenioides]